MANNAEDHMEKASLLLTRPQASASQFCAQLDASVMAGVRVVISPLLKIIPTGAVVDLTGNAGAIFTSAYAPACVENGKGRAAYCVGDRTAQVARECDWNVTLVAETADDLVSKMGDVRGPLLHLAGQHRRGEIADRLTANGVATQVVVIYDQLGQPLNSEARSLLSNADLIVAPLFSPRSAHLFVEQVQELANVHIIAMSGAVVVALGTIIPKQVHIAVAPTGEEMRRCVEKLLGGTTSP